MFEDDIGALLKRINDKMKIAADAELKESGFTISQTSIVEFLLQNEGRSTQKEIENFLNVAHPTVVGMVSRLEKKGFVTCYVDEGDRRNKIVCITEKARENAEKMRQGRKDHEAKLLESLNEEEIAELRRMLKVLYSNVK